VNTRDAKTVEAWSLTGLRDKLTLVKTDPKVVGHGRYATFQMADRRGVAAGIRGHPDADRPAAGVTGAGVRAPRADPTHDRGEARSDGAKALRFSSSTQSPCRSDCLLRMRYAIYRLQNRARRAILAS
jgi:hypothetical protein